MSWSVFSTKLLTSAKSSYKATIVSVRLQFTTDTVSWLTNSDTYVFTLLS